MDAMKVLLVDDEREYLDTLVKRLRKRNIPASGVDSGEKALVAMKNQEIDVVVLDVKMPGMDGIETLREIKSRYPLVEVIMLTGHASLEVAVEGMEFGAFDYLMKPISIDEILYKLEDAHQKRRLHLNKIKKGRMNLSAKSDPVSGKKK